MFYFSKDNTSKGTITTIYIINAEIETLKKIQRQQFMDVSCFKRGKTSADFLDLTVENREKLDEF